MTSRGRISLPPSSSAISSCSLRYPPSFTALRPFFPPVVCLPALPSHPPTLLILLTPYAFRVLSFHYPWRREPTIPPYGSFSTTVRNPARACSRSLRACIRASGGRRAAAGGCYGVFLVAGEGAGHHDDTSKEGTPVPDRVVKPLVIMSKNSPSPPSPAR